MMMSETTPSTWPGVILALGKKKPVMLVSAVKSRNKRRPAGRVLLGVHGAQHDEAGQDGDDADDGVQERKFGGGETQDHDAALSG